MILGADSSWWQGAMDWRKCEEAGARFAYIRAGSINHVTGNCYYDYAFPTNVIEAPKHLPTGAYWFFRSKWDALKQAKYFVDLIKGMDLTLPPVIDVETADAPMLTMRRRILEFVSQAENMLGIRPMIYTRGIFWNDNVGHVEWADKYALWIARYTTQEGPWSDGYCKPHCWDDWRLWQFSADGNMRGEEFGAESNSIDLNKFNGTEEDFQSWIGKEEQEVYTLNIPGYRVEIRKV